MLRKLPAWLTLRVRGKFSIALHFINHVVVFATELVLSPVAPKGREHGTTTRHKPTTPVVACSLGLDASATAVCKL